MKFKSTFLRGLMSLGIIAASSGVANAYSLETSEVERLGDGTFVTHVQLNNGIDMYFKVMYNGDYGVWSDSKDYVARIKELHAYGISDDLVLPDEISFQISEYDWDNDSEVKFTINAEVNGIGVGGHQEFWRSGNENINLTVPANYVYLRSMSDNSFNSIILLPSTPPAVDNCNEAEFIIQNANYNVYQSYIDNGYNGWNDGIIILPTTTYDLNIATTAGNLEDTILANLGKNGNLGFVGSLKVTGQINGRDMNAFAKMKPLKILDLSGVTVVSNERDDQYIRGCRGIKSLETVKLPSGVTTIDDETFQDCHRLKNINLKNITYIGSNAFRNCYQLLDVDLSNVKQMGGSAFESCWLLTSVNLSKLDKITWAAFADCFSLNKIVFSPNLTIIEPYAFQYTNIETFEVPANAHLSSYAIRGYNTKNVILNGPISMDSATLDEIENLENVYWYDPIPCDYNILVRNNPVIHVPAFAIDSFNDNANYYQFGKVVALTDDIDYIDVYKDLLINSTKGIANGFDMQIERVNSFVNTSSSSLNMNSFTQNSIYNPSRYYGFENILIPSSSFISEGKSTANEVKVNLYLPNANYNNSNQWSFLSFPFNVKISDIVTPDEALWVIREYDGAARAANPYDGNSKWKNKTDGVLEAGKGYIFHFSKNNYDFEYYYSGYGWHYFNQFTFPAVKDAKMNNIFANEDVVVSLNYYDSEFDHNKSWNLVGNPFDSYYDINSIQYGVKSGSGITRSPITVWRCLDFNTYEAFSADDNYVLQPFEAFFVQAIDKDNVKMTFKKDGRVTYGESSRYMAPAKDNLEGTERHLFNFHISGETGSDRTRLVINEEASEAYEIACDASKFLAPGEEVPQIYMLEGNEKFAINERPFGLGEYNMGVRIGRKGVYTISCDVRNANSYNVILIDRLTGKETQIAKENYSFNAEEGDDTRFAIRLEERGSGIESIDDIKNIVNVNGQELSVSAEGQINVYSIDGKIVATGVDELTVSLPKGVYVVKAGASSRKAVVR